MIQVRRNGEAERRPSSAAPAGEAASRAALRWLQGETTPRLLVDRNLRILWANNAAASLLDAGDGVRERGGFLTTGKQGWDSELRGAVGRATSAVSAWSIPVNDGEEDQFVLQVRKVSDMEPAAYGISFYGTGEGLRAAYLPLDRIFQLTAAEHRTLLDLLDGHEAIAIARFRKLSVETVRSHIRHIYMKLNVRTREAMFHKLRGYQVRV